MHMENWKHQVLTILSGPVEPGTVSWFWSPDLADEMNVLVRYIERCIADVVVASDPVSAMIHQTFNSHTRAIVMHCPEMDCTADYAILEELQAGAWRISGSRAMTVVVLAKFPPDLKGFRASLVTTCRIGTGVMR